MERWKRIKNRLHRLFFPHGILLALLVPFSAAVLVYALDYGTNPLLLAVSGMLSIYTILALCCRLPQILTFWMKMRTENELVLLYENDIRVHESVSLYFAQAIDLIYAVFQLFLGVSRGSVWYISMGAYYALLFVMRLYLLIYLGKHSPGEDMSAEYKREYFCGRCLIILNGLLFIIVLCTIVTNAFSAHHPLIALVMAVYTFSSFASSLRTLMQYRKYKSPVLTSDAAVSLAAGLVSILNLETTMLASFGSEDQFFYNAKMMLLGGVLVTLLVLGIAGVMMMHAKKGLERLSLKEEMPGVSEQEGEMDVNKGRGNGEG